MDELLKDAEDAFRQGLGANTATAMVGMTVRRAQNAAGEPSLFLRLVFKRDLVLEDFEAIRRATLDLASWLNEHGHSNLYPYINLTTEQEEAEEAEAG